MKSYIFSLLFIILTQTNANVNAFHIKIIKNYSLIEVKYYNWNADNYLELPECARSTRASAIHV